MSNEQRQPARTSTWKLAILLGCSTVLGIIGAEVLTVILSEPAAIVEPRLTPGSSASHQPAADGRLAQEQS